MGPQGCKGRGNKLLLAGCDTGLAEGRRRGRVVADPTSVGQIASRVENSKKELKRGCKAQGNPKVMSESSHCEGTGWKDAVERA